MRTGALSYDTIARSAAESVAPELWPDHAWVPALGATGGVLPDVAGGNHAVISGNYSWGPGYVDFVGGSATAPVPSVGKSLEFTVMTDVHPVASPAAWCGLYCEKDGSNNNAFSVQRSASWPDIRLYVNTTSKDFFGAFPLGVRAHLIGKKDTANCYLSQNGLPFVAQAFNTAITVTATATVLMAERGGIGCAGKLYHTYVWRRLLTDADASRLSADPLLPFRRRRLRSWFLPTAGGFKPWWAKDATVLIGSAQ